jgi:hypothetical protein
MQQQHTATTCALQSCLVKLQPSCNGVNVVSHTVSHSAA